MESEADTRRLVAGKLGDLTRMQVAKCIMGLRNVEANEKQRFYRLRRCRLTMARNPKWRKALSAVRAENEAGKVQVERHVQPTALPERCPHGRPTVTLCTQYRDEARMGPPSTAAGSNNAPRTDGVTGIKLKSRLNKKTDARSTLYGLPPLDFERKPKWF